MTIQTQGSTKHFTNTLKMWRKTRKFSQLELALEANISQRHVSWLETGKSSPSREMVLKLSEALDVPLRERNSILNAAGFANVYAEKNLEERSMHAFTSVLENIISHHNPYPAFVLDRVWNIKMKNTSAEALFAMLGNPEEIWRAIGDNGQENIALLTVHPNGIRSAISNWDTIIGPFMQRLKREAIDSSDSEVMAHYESLLEHVGDIDDSNSHQALTPVLPIEINLGEITLSLFSVISTFGTAQDITADELKIETFYPSDDETENFFHKI